MYPPWTPARKSNPLTAGGYGEAPAKMNHYAWRRSADRTGLQANTLLTGNFTGKIAISGLKELIW
jgi:hypothetical protein